MTKDGDNHIDSIELFSGIKYSGYQLPQIWLGTGIPQDKAPTPAWHVEIWINRICVFRDSAASIDNANLQKFEKELLEKLMISVFMHGISSSYNFIKNLKKNNFGE